MTFLPTSGEDTSSPPSSPAAAPAPRRIVVAHRLPLIAEPNPDAPHGFDFFLNPESLPLQLSRGLADPIVFVGTLPSSTSSSTEALAADLLSRFSCIPVFLGHHADYHDRFCNNYLRPILHGILPLAPAATATGAMTFDAELYRAYLTANTRFAERVIELFTKPDDDDGDLVVIIHDYHLWPLPTLLRRKWPRARIGFFLHAPFPAAELFRASPVRSDLLRALLNADLVGFQTFDHARNFLSSCSRVLGVSLAGVSSGMGVEYSGRTVAVKVLSVGVDVSQLRSVLSLPETSCKMDEIAGNFAGRQLLLGVDNVDAFNDITFNLKFLAMEKLLESRAELRGRVMFVQIMNNPGRRDIHKDVRTAIMAIRDRVNGRFGSPGYKPIVMIDGPLPMHEKLAFYASASVLVATAGGRDTTPYIYTVCQQDGTAVPVAGTGAIVISEFSGSSSALGGAVRVNPWSASDVADAIGTALLMDESERRTRQERHYRYVVAHDVALWARAFDYDLQRASERNASRTMHIMRVGLAMAFRAVALGPSFRKLLAHEHLCPAYQRSSNRLILLDYDGTLMATAGVMNRAPSQKVIRVLNELCSDAKNGVFIVSGRGKDQLDSWFAQCKKLGICAEHSYFTRWSQDSPWEVSKLMVKDSGWKNMAQSIMEHYVDATDGSYIEVKETALVWHYDQVDPEFGACQARELLDHLQDLLANEPVSVQSGHQIVEVRPQGVGKGVAVECLIAAMGTRKRVPDFVLCIGDDRSDEDMFKAISAHSSNSAFPERAAGMFACTVGKKPSLANYYLDDPADVLKMLRVLTDDSSTQRHIPLHPQLLLEAFVE